MMTLTKCSIELLNDEECDATGDASSNIAGYKISLTFFL